MLHLDYFSVLINIFPLLAAMLVAGSALEILSVCIMHVVLVVVSEQSNKDLKDDLDDLLQKVIAVILSGTWGRAEWDSLLKKI